MGRLTLNMLLSFAQFEREVAGGQVRGKIAATFRKGIFVCGQPPLGYRRPQEGDDPPNNHTACHPRTGGGGPPIADYLELGSLKDVTARLNAAGHTARQSSGEGRAHGGRQFDAGLVYLIMNNPIYLGCVAGTRGPGRPRSGPDCTNPSSRRRLGTECRPRSRTHQPRGSDTLDAHSLAEGQVHVRGLRHEPEFDVALPDENKSGPPANGRAFAITPARRG